MSNKTEVKRKSDREVVVSRVVDGAARHVFEAWSNADLFRKWWVPKSFPVALHSCEMDVRVGGTYRLVFGAPPEQKAFFGRYLEVVPSSRLVWTNEEDGLDAAVISTVTFEERDGKTHLTMVDLHPSKEACDAAIGSGSIDAMPEVWDQLEELVVSRK